MLAGSFAAHLLALALVLLVHVVAPPKPPDQPAFGVVFQPSTTQTRGAPKPGKITMTPQGEPDRALQPTPQPQVSPRITPPTPAPTPPREEPEVNLLPPEYQQAEEPPPPQERAEPVPQRQPRHQRSERAQARPRAQPSRNPFANPMQFSYAPQPRSGPSGGLRNSRSLDLSAGPVVAGGRLQDAVAHVIGPGGAQDWNALLQEFVEEHKYYPPRAGNNGEQGYATVQFIAHKDGTITGLRLVTSSGSSILDAAWMAVFRDNRLPPFTDDMPQSAQPITFTMDYELLYR
jgi:TonB family protein